MEEPNKSFFDEEKNTESGAAPTEPTPEVQDGQEGQVRMPQKEGTPPRNNGESLATISLLLGVASILCCGLPAGIGAIIAALLSRKRLGKFNATSISGLLIGVISLLLTVFMFVMVSLIMELIESAVGEGALLFLPPLLR